MLLFGVALHAGTTVIHVDTTGNGQVIDSATGVVMNDHGALFWTGSQWVSDDTAAHMFFTDLRTGLRLQDYTTTTFQGNAAGTFTDRGYTIQRSVYSYQKSTSAGRYSFSAVQYQITDPAGRRVVLRSRGTGVGPASASFDIYVENPTGTTVIAMRGDPGWFNYATMDLALAATSTAAGKQADLPTPGGDYYLDANGGSDMGGQSWEFHTSALTVANPVLTLGSSFATDFSVKFMDAANTLGEIRFLPYAEGTFTPLSTPSPTPVPPSAILLVTGLGGAALYEIRKRRRHAGR